MQATASQQRARIRLKLVLRTSLLIGLVALLAVANLGSSLLTSGPVELSIAGTRRSLLQAGTAAPTTLGQTYAPTVAPTVATKAPTTKVGTDAPTTKVVTDAPTVTVTTSAPTVTVITGAPTVTVTTGAPTVTVTTGAPTVTVTTTAPTTTVVTGAPTTTVQTTAPTTTVTTGAPTTAVTTTAPTTTVTTGAPTTSAATVPLCDSSELQTVVTSQLTAINAIAECSSVVSTLIPLAGTATQAQKDAAAALDMCPCLSAMDAELRDELVAVLACRFEGGPNMKEKTTCAGASTDAPTSMDANSPDNSTDANTTDTSTGAGAGTNENGKQEMGEVDLLDLTLSGRDALTKEQIRSGGVVFYIFGMIYMFVCLAVVCDEFFVPSLEVIAETTGMSNEVAGATLMAAGGSAPELFTSFIGTFAGSAVGFGTIVGSAVFNVLFVIAMCAIFSKEVLSLTWWPLARDSTYYALSLSVLALFFTTGRPDPVTNEPRNEIVWWESLILFVMYFGYVIVMKFHVQLHGKIVACCRKKTDLDQVAEGEKKLEVNIELAELDVEDDDEPTHISQTNRLYMKSDADFRRPSTFRAGFMQLMLTDKPILETAGLHVCHKIHGTAIETFEKLDKDGSGCLERNEVKSLLSSMGVAKVTEDQVDKMMSEIDADGDGKITFIEFEDWYIRSEDRIKAEIHEAFVSLDANNNGRVEGSELRKLLARINGKDAQIPEEVVKQAMQEMDGDGDGEVNEEEFNSWYFKSELFQQKKNDIEEEADANEGLSLAWPKGIRAQISYLLMIPITYPLYFFFLPAKKKRTLGWGLYGFFGSICFIGGYSYLMVWWTEVFGACFQIPSVVMGLTFLAAGTSVPDLLSSVIVARQGEGDMAVSSSLGSNIFDVLVGLPLPWLIYNIVGYAAGWEDEGIVTVGASALGLSIGILIAMLVCVIGIIAACGWKMTKTLGVLMLVLYVVFVAQDLARNLT